MRRCGFPEVQSRWKKKEESCELWRKEMRSTLESDARGSLSGSMEMFRWVSRNHVSIDQMPPAGL